MEAQMSLVAVKKNDDGDDPRGALREAIAARAVAHAKAEQHQQAIHRARNMLGAAEARVTVAGEALEAVRTGHAEALAQAAASGGTPKPNGALRDARLALADAEDGAEAARAALERVKADSGDFGDEVAHADSGVLVAIAEVVRPVGEELLAKAKRLRTELACTLSVLSGLAKEEFANDARDRQLPTFSSIYKDQTARDARNAPTSALRAALAEFNSLATQDEVKQAAKQATDVYVRWRGALRENADAELPPWPFRGGG
jgi:hypothetical protein